MFKNIEKISRSVVQLLLLSTSLTTFLASSQSSENLPAGFDFFDGEDGFVTIESLQIGSCYKF